MSRLLIPALMIPALMIPALTLSSAALAHEGMHHHPHGIEYGWIVAALIGFGAGLVAMVLARWRK